MATYTQIPTKDTFIADDNPTFNWDGLGLRTGVITGPWVRRMLLHFDLSDFPDYLSIDDARMEFSLTLDGILDVAAKVYRITQTAWVENAATWNKYNALTNWTTPGGDYDATTPTPVQFFQPRNPGSMTITGLAGFVIDAIDNRSSQLHTLMRQNDEASAFGEYKYKDAELEESLGVHRPELIVTYTRPSTERIIDDPRSTIGAAAPSQPAQASAVSSAARPARGAAPARS